MHVAHTTHWQTIDEAIVLLSTRAGALDVEIGRWFLAAQQENVHRRLGFASFPEYVLCGWDTTRARPGRECASHVR